MKFVVTIIVFINLLPALCCGQQIVWQNHYGSIENEICCTYDNTFIMQAADGGYIVCGNFWTLDTAANQYAVKAYSDGSFDWELKAGYPWEGDGTYANVKTFDGNYFIVGNANMQSINANDIRITKFNDEGDTIFSKITISSNIYQASPRDICYTNDSNYILACSSAYNIYLTKLDNNADTIWTRRPLPDSIGSAAPLFFQPAPDFSAYYGIIWQNNYKSHWFKTDTAGNLLNIKQLYSENGAWVHEIIKGEILPNGNLLVHGRGDDGNPYPCSDGTGYYGFLYEYNQEGEIVRKHFFCDDPYDTFEDYFVAEDGSIYLVKNHRLKKLNADWEDEWEYDLDLSEYVWLSKISQFSYGYIIAAGEQWMGVENTDIFMCKIALPEAIGVEENEEEPFKFNAYPNPTTGELILESSLPAATYYTVAVSDGKLIAQGSFTNRIEIDLMNVSYGAYHLLLQNKEGTILYRQLISKQ